MDAAMRRAIQDVRSKGRTGKAVFVFVTTWVPEYKRPNNGQGEYAYRPPYNISRPLYADPFVNIMVEAWDSGIVTVFAAGNIEPGLVTQGGQHSTRFPTSDNAMIMVSSVDRSGNPSPLNTPPGPPPGIGPLDAALIGSTTNYAHAKFITVANSSMSDKYKIVSGTSFAAPQIAGLVAYFLGLPNLLLPARVDDIAMAMKSHIVRTQRNDPRVDGFGVAYNVEDAISWEDK
ncbi:MAG: hypothetical protein Q9226_001877, partial [Calogaya cf. arnoldii]